MWIGKIPRTAVATDNLHRHAFRKIFFQMCLCQIQNFVTSLIRNESKRKLRHCMTCDHGLGPLPLITAADPVYLRRGPCPNSLDRIVTSFAEEFGGAGFLTN